MEIIITPGGQLHCLYGEAIDLHVFGRLEIHRASHVEPDESGRWRADLSPVQGPVLGPFDRRSDALAAERRWLQANRLNRPG
jgi:hypothetical protein